MSRNVIHLMLLVSFFVGTPRVIAGFDITALNLKCTTTDTSSGTTVEDSETISQITNPLSTPILTSVGPNAANATYDFSWIESLAIGDFDMTLSHVMRNSPGIRTVTRTQIFIEPDEDLIVAVEGSVDYAIPPAI